MLLDIHLPGVDGVQLLKQVKATPRHETLPVVMITADESDQLLADCLGSGAVDYIRKPLQAIPFKARVQSVLRASEHQRQLLHEILEHQRTSSRLRGSQQRLSRMLDLMEEGMLAVDGQQRVTYLNQQAQRWLSLSGEPVLHQPLNQVLPDLELPPAPESGAEALEPVTAQVEIPRAEDAPLLCQAMIRAIRLPGEDIRMVRIALLPTPLPTSADEAPQRESLTLRMQQLELMVSGMWQLLREEGARQLQLRNVLPADLDELQDEVPPSPTRNGLRQRLVETLQLAVGVWERTTGQGMIELAEESGLWNVYHDPDGGAYARTLDKYLTLERLPQHPRWRTVLQTAYFVLNHMSPNPELHARLSSQIDRLQKLLRKSSVS